MAWNLVDNITGPQGPPGPTDWTEGDTRYVNVGGDTMTGGLVIAPATMPQLPTDAAIWIGGAAQSKLGIDNNDLQAFTSDGVTPTYLYLQRYGGSAQVGSQTINGSLDLRGVDGANTPINFYSGATRVGTIFPFGTGAASDLAIQSLLSGRGVALQSSSWISFATAATERARVDINGHFLIGMATAGAGSAGLWFHPGNQYLYIGNQNLNQPNHICDKFGAANAGGSDFIHFRLANVTKGSIVSTGTTGVVYNTTSDYRLKTERGPITEGLARVERLRPIRVTWNEDETQTEVDSLLAHEVAEVVPDAVTGEKDAVDEAGEIVAQQMDASRLIPMMVAAIQELSAEVRSLRAELDLLTHGGTA